MNSTIYSTPWDMLFTDDIESSWDIWKQTYLAIMQHCSPHKYVTLHKTLPWMDEQLLVLIEKEKQMAKRTMAARAWERY